MFDFLQRKGNADTAPHLSQLSREATASLEALVELREIEPRLGPLAEKKVVQMIPHEAITAMVRQKGASLVAEVDWQPQSLRKLGPPVSGYLSLRSRIDHLPLADQSWDLVLCSALDLGQVPLSRVVSGIARILRSGGQAVIADWHPFSPMAQQAHPSRMGITEEGGPLGFARYFRIFRDYNLVMHGVREVFFDGSLRSQMDKKAFSRLEGQPFLIVFFLTKISRGTE